jgi:hypothetical protein
MPGQEDRQACMLFGKELAAGEEPRTGRWGGQYVDRYLLPKLIEF